MKRKIVALITVGLLVVTGLFTIAPINAAIVMPRIKPGDPNPPPPPWEGTPADPIDFYAEIGDPDELFIDEPPFVWTWTFSRGVVHKTWSTDDEFPGEPYYGTSWGWDHHLFDSDNDKGDWEVEITVTNAADQTLTWPYYWPAPDANVHIGFEGNLVCYERPQIWPIWLQPGCYRVYVLGANEGEEICPKHWNTHIYWEGDPEQRVANNVYPYDLDPDETLGHPFPSGNYVIEFARRAYGRHSITICLDADKSEQDYGERYEGLANEDDNCVDVSYNFWW